MEFNYYTHHQYFTAEEQRHLDDFLALGLKSGYICKNKKGEERLVHNVNYPAEMRIDGSTVYQYDPIKETNRYYTAIATLHGTKVGSVIYEDDSGMYNVSSVDFMKWLGDDWSYSLKEEKESIVPDFVKQRLNNLKAKEKNTAETPEEFKEKTEIWNPTGNVKTPKRKPARKKKEE